MKKIKLVLLTLILLSACSTITSRTTSPANTRSPATMTPAQIRADETKYNERQPFVSTQTSTLPPTLRPSEITSKLIHLYANNKGCELPCWWGITPGSTSWESTKLSLAQLGRLETHMLWNNQTIIYFTAQLPQYSDPIIGPLPEGYNLGVVQASFLVIDNEIAAISINSRWVSKDYSFSLSSLLNSFGKPDEIWLKASPKNGSLPVRYSLKILYANKGMIQLDGVGKIIGNSIHICPQSGIGFDGLPPWLYFWSPEHNVSFKQNAEILRAFDQYYDELYIGLEDATLGSNMTAERFFETFRNPETKECLKIKSPFPQ